MRAYLNNTISLVVLILIIVLSGCKQDTKHTNDGVIVIDVRESFKNKQKTKLSEIFKDVELIKLETGADIYISNALYFDISKNYLLVNDPDQNQGTGQVFLFTRKGKFINKIGNHGKGPGEYLRSTDILLDEKDNKIIIVDASKRTLNMYDLRGNFIKDRSIREETNNIGILGIERLNDQHFAIEIASPKKVTNNYSRILIYNKEFQLENRLFVDSPDKYVHYGNTNLCQSPNGPYFWASKLDTLFYLKDGFSPEPAIFFKTSNEKYPENQKIHIFTVNDLGDKVLMFVSSKEGENIIIYDKKSKESYLVENKVDCRIDNYLSTLPDFENDYFGLEPLIKGYYLSAPNALDFRINTEWYLMDIDIECLKTKSVLKPGLRDEIIDIIQKPDETSCVIGLLYLK